MSYYEFCQGFALYGNSQDEHYAGVSNYDEDMADYWRSENESEAAAEFQHEFYTYCREDGYEEWVINYLWNMENEPVLWTLPRQIQDAYISSTVDDIPF